jgi:hypothetical protein
MILIYAYELFQSTVESTDSIKDLGVFLDSKLYFHDHVSFIFSRCIMLLGLVRSVIFNSLSLECMFTLYFTLVKSKVECASVVRNSVTSTDANKLERTQQKFAGHRFKSLLSSSKLWLWSCFKAVKIEDFETEDVSSRCTVPYTCLLSL